MTTECNLDNAIMLTIVFFTSGFNPKELSYFYYNLMQLSFRPTLWVAHRDNYSLWQLFTVIIIIHCEFFTFSIVHCFYCSLWHFLLFTMNIFHWAFLLFTVTIFHCTILLFTVSIIAFVYAGGCWVLEVPRSWPPCSRRPWQASSPERQYNSSNSQGS